MQTITGVLPPITPSLERCTSRTLWTGTNSRWLRGQDYWCLLSAQKRSSVTQLDKQNSVSSIESHLPDLIAPPGCSIHPGSRSTCVFRPCSHVSCLNCQDFAMLAGSKCPKCQAGIEKFVALQRPISLTSQNTGNAGQGEWSVKETVWFASNAASSDTVIVIHPLEVRPSPLYSSGYREILGDRLGHHWKSWEIVWFLQEPLCQEWERGMLCRNWGFKDVP